MKDFVIISRNNTYSKNGKPYHIDVDGIVLDRMKKNGAGGYEHKLNEHPVYNCVKWSNLRVTDAGLIGTPEFSTDSFGSMLKDKVVNGFINGASGTFRPVNTTLENGVNVIKKSVLMEASITSIPADENSLIMLSLNNNRIINIKDMEEKDELEILSNEIIEESVPVSLSELVKQKDEELVSLSAQLVSKDEELIKLSVDVQNLMEMNKQLEMAGISIVIDKLIETGKFTGGQKDALIYLYQTNKEMFDTLVENALEPVSLNVHKLKTNKDEVVSLSYNQLIKENPRELLRIKNEQPSLYEELYKQNKK